MRRGAGIVAGFAVGYAAVLALVFWRVLLRDQMSGWDCAVEYWPDLVFQIDALGDGEWPGWNPYALGGYAYWADPQNGLFSPVNWLCWLLAAIGGHGPWLIQAKVWILMLLGCGGMHLWTWTRTGSHVAGVVAALTLVLGGPALVMKNSAILWPIMYAPWLLLALERFVPQPTVRRGAALAGAIWLVAGAGSPPGTFYVALVGLAYAVFLALASPTPRLAHRVVARAWRGLAAVAVLTPLLLAAIYLPASDLAATSQRASRGLGYVLQQPLSAGALDELLAPGLDRNWQHDLYVGALALLGGIWLAATARRARIRAEAGFWLGAVLLGVLLALGRDGHLLPWLAEHGPGFGLFRIAYRYKLIVGIAAAVLAGDAAGALQRGDAPRWARWVWSGGAIGWLIGAIAVGAATASWLLAGAVLIAASALAWLATPEPGSAPRWRRIAITVAAIAVPVLLLADLWHAGADKLAILMRRPSPDRDVAAATVLTGTGGRDAAWRYHVGNAASPYGGTVPYHVAFLARRRELSGYPHPMEPLRHVELSKRAKKAPGLLRHFNVRYFAGHAQALPGARTVGPRIVEVDDVAPVARWYAGAVVLRDRDVLERLATTAPSQLSRALVEKPDVAGLELPDGEAAPVDGTLVRLDRGEVVVEIDAPAAGILVINEAWGPGWTAEVDGRAARVFRAQYHLRAVLVPAGPSRVVMRYQPRGRIALPLLFLLGLSGLLVALLGRWRWLDRGPASP